MLESPCPGSECTTPGSKPIPKSWTRSRSSEPLALRDARGGLVEGGEVDVGRRRRDDLAEHVRPDLEATPHDRRPRRLVVRRLQDGSKHAAFVDLAFNGNSSPVIVLNVEYTVVSVIP